MYHGGAPAVPNPADLLEDLRSTGRGCPSLLAGHESHTERCRDWLTLSKSWLQTKAAELQHGRSAPYGGAVAGHHSEARRIRSRDPRAMQRLVSDISGRNSRSTPIKAVQPADQEDHGQGFD